MKKIKLLSLFAIALLCFSAVSCDDSSDDSLSFPEQTISDGYTGQVYSYTLQSEGGSGTLTWSITSGSLPLGIYLNTSTGEIYGTPTGTGSSAVTFRVRDTGDGSVTRSFSIVIHAPLVILTDNFAVGVVGVAYSQLINSSGGDSPHVWSITAGAGTLPDGLTIDPDTGIISGTPTISGDFNFTVNMADDNGEYVEKIFLISIKGLMITTTSLSDGAINTVYSDTLTASGSNTPFTWTITAGTLPAGLSLTTAGVLEGTPTEESVTDYSITVEVTDSLANTDSKVLSLTVAPVSLNTTSLPDVYVSIVYSQILSATGGDTPYAWTLESGTLPTGITLDALTGELAGTPSASGTYNFTIRVTQNSGSFDEQALSIFVKDPLAVTTSTLANANVLGSYYQALTASGGTGSYTWTVTSGNLAMIGMSMNSAGEISGTPAVDDVGTYNFTFLVTDSASDTASAILSIEVIALDYSSSISIGGPGDEYIQKVLYDGNGNLYIAGYFYGAVDFADPYGATADIHTSNGFTDGFVTKIDNTGAYVWTYSIGDTGYDYIADIALDAAGNVIIVGEFSDTVVFGPGGAGVGTLASAGSYDGFIMRLQPDSTFDWVYQIGSTGADRIKYIAIDNSDNVYITGYYNDTVDFGADFGSADIKIADDTDEIFLTKLDASAVYSTTYVFPTTRDGDTNVIGKAIEVNGLCFDGNNDVTLMGIFWGSVDFGYDFSSTDSRSSVDDSDDIFLVKVLANDSYGFSKTIGDSGDEKGYSIKFTNNRMIFCGSFSGTVDFGNPFSTLDSKTATGGTDAFITLLNTNGTYDTTYIFGGTTDDAALDADVDSNDNVILTGTFTGIVNFASDFSGTDSKTQSIGYYSFITKIYNDGTYMYTKEIAGDLSHYAVTSRVLIDSFNTVMVAGNYQGTVDFASDLGDTDSNTSETLGSSKDIFYIFFD